MRRHLALSLALAAACASSPPAQPTPGKADPAAAPGGSGAPASAAPAAPGTTPAADAGKAAPPAAAASAPGAQPAGPTPQPLALDFKELADDTVMTLPSGATFTVVKGWHVAKADTMVVLQEPEKELAAAMVELTAPTAEEAVAQAWKKWKPDFARTVRTSMKPPPREGWDEVLVVNYETTAQEYRAVQAVDRRKGTTHYVMLIDGAIAAAGRRGAQLNIAASSLKVPGKEEENLAGKTAHKLDEARLAQFAEFAEKTRQLAKVPGAAIAVIQGGKVIFEKGFGVRELGKNDPVTPDTLFMIGSMTKPLTSLLMARLVDQKRFSWDTPVTRLMPSFALGDADATKKLTMAHTVCACTGLPRQDMEFIFEWAKATPESRVAAMKEMKPTTGFGETFQYSNTMVSTGGYVAAKAVARGGLALAYATAMQNHVFGPLKMPNTLVDPKAVGRREHAMPHGRDLNFDPQPVPLDVEGAVMSVMPAGGAWSNVRDISRWLLLELGKGKLDGKQLVTEASLLERRKPRVKINAKASYGLALFLDESRGLQSIGHGGNTLGFTADAVWFPEHDVALVTLTNAAAANGWTGAVRRKLVETLFDANPEAEEGLKYGLKQLAEILKKEHEEIQLKPDAAFIEPLVGTWTNPALGTLEIRREGGGAGSAGDGPEPTGEGIGSDYLLDAGEWKVKVGQHNHKDGTKKVVSITPPVVELEFWPQEKDGKKVLLFEAVQQKYWFERASSAGR